MKTTTLPDSFLRRMSKEDRAQLGRGGMTQDEALAKFEARNERQLQEQIANYLRLNGIFFIRSRMDKKSTTQCGTPDFCFCVPRILECPPYVRPTPTAIEVKYGKGALSDEQIEVHAQMITNGWHVHVVHTFDEAVKAIGL